MKIELEKTTDNQEYDFFIDGERVEGELSNVNVAKKFVYKSEGQFYDLSSEQLRAIADKLDELNGVKQ